MIVLHIFFIYAICQCGAKQDGFVDKEKPPKEVSSNKSTYKNKFQTANDTDQFDNFGRVLLEVTTDQIKHIKNNILTNYDLHKTDVTLVKKAIADSETQYLEIVKSKLQTTRHTEQIGLSEHFMIDFMELSNYILEKVLDNHIHNLRDKGSKGSIAKWNRHTLKQKILRQQIKISTNIIESRICNILKICKEKRYYSDYLSMWIRIIMALDASGLKRFFAPIPDILEKHKHVIKSNIKFRQTIKYLITSNAMVKRDTLDFVDEIITNPDNVLKLASASLKKSVSDLRELFVLIDGAYDVNVENVKSLNKVTEWIKEWVEGKTFDVHKIMNAMVENIDLNMKIWPLDIQKKIYYVWSEVITL